MRRSFALLAGGVALAAGASSATADIVNGQIDTFQDGTVQGWGNGIIEELITNEDGGPLGAGDRYLQVATTGDLGGPGSRVAVFNRMQWTGDYLAAGVTSITMDVLNTTAGGEDLELRVMLFCDVGTVFTSTLATVVGVNDGWTTISFDISESALTRVSGSLSYDDSLTGVNRLLIRHQPGAPAGPGGAAELPGGLMGLDNIRAVPTPGAVAVFVLGGALAGRRRR